MGMLFFFLCLCIKHSYMLPWTIYKMQNCSAAHKERTSQSLQAKKHSCGKQGPTATDVTHFLTLSSLPFSLWCWSAVSTSFCLFFFKLENYLFHGKIQNNRPITSDSVISICHSMVCLPLSFLLPILMLCYYASSSKQELSIALYLCKSWNSGFPLHVSYN